jgi:ABC-type branched-subunit amino acid transport system substrate-binding protein
VAARLRQHLVLTLTVDQEGVQADGVPSRLESAGCEVLVWTGFSAGAALVRTEMVGAGLEDVPLLGSDAMKDDAYLTATGTAGRRTLVTCPCVDLSTATDLPAQRFIHDYQSEYGGPPGAYAAEAWDVASMLVAALAADGTGGQAVAASLRDLEGFRGLAGKYAFGEGGERDPQGVLEAFMDEGGRWIPWNQAS